MFLEIEVHDGNKYIHSGKPKSKSLRLLEIRKENNERKKDSRVGKRTN